MKNLVKNATSGFLVFLIALPLCLGIALASGFPPVAGVLTAIVGGVMISHIGSAPLTIKGPAAGIIVIALGAVQELGMGDPVLGYKRALAVGVAAAVVQIVFGLLKAGRFAAIMPPSVVHGMLAAIGVIIIAKQLPIALGVVGAGGEPIEMLLEIPHYLYELNPMVAGIGLLSVLVLVLLPLSPFKPVRKVPAAIVVLLLTVPIAAYLQFGVAHDYSAIGGQYSVGPEFLVTLPGSLLDAITFPDFSVILSFTSIKYVVMFALVGSIESLLSVIAVDGMDPEKRTSNLNRDLVVTGVGNLVCGAIGGLPMISEIVRSKANVDAKATGPWSNFFHGIYLLLFVAFAPGLLQMIPLAALAAMLVITGARLASPLEFKHSWRVGWDQLLLFVTTFVLTLAVDLLVGVAVGLALKLLLHLIRTRSGLGLFRSPLRIAHEGGDLLIRVKGPLAFTNLMYLLNALKREITPQVERVRIDLSRATLVDHTTQERLQSAANEFDGVELEIVGLSDLNAGSSHPHAVRLSA